MTDVIDEAHPVEPVSQRQRHWLASGLQLFLTVATPLLLTLLSARLVMTPFFINLEYNRAGFPEDVYGFSREDRMMYAPYALTFMLNDVPASYLGDLSMPGPVCWPALPEDTTCPMYNERELRHMVDVQLVTRAVFVFALLLGLAAVAAVVVLAVRPAYRPMLRRALFSGGIATLSLIAAIVIGAIVNWNTFFTLFHEVFFESGTWRFRYSDTLIRLFPEQFWFDAALTIGILTSAGAVALIVITWQWGKRAERH